jgi:catechol 2,3-dioxygenase-like lactoylglutathione lyase family enzyme
MKHSKKMDRREILQLGLGATVAFASGAVPAFAAGIAYKAVAVNHISYNVADVHRSRDWYVDLLGMKVVWNEESASGQTSHPKNFQRSSLEFGDPPNQLSIKSVTHGEGANVDHYAISIENYDPAPVKEELARRGLDPKYDGPLAWNIIDPDGYRFQVTAIKGVYPGASNDRAQDLGTKDLDKMPKPNEKSLKSIAVNYMSYNVADYGKSRDFYMELLGMKKTFDDGKQCALEFGDPAAPNGLFIRNVKTSGEKAHVDYISYSVAAWDRSRIEAELKRRGLYPKPAGKNAWAIKDPDGYQLQICAPNGIDPAAAAEGEF